MIMARQVGFFGTWNNGYTDKLPYAIAIQTNEVGIKYIFVQSSLKNGDKIVIGEREYTVIKNKFYASTYGSNDSVIVELQTNVEFEIELNEYEKKVYAEVSEEPIHTSRFSFDYMLRHIDQQFALDILFRKGIIKIVPCFTYGGWKYTTY